MKKEVKKKVELGILDEVKATVAGRQKHYSTFPETMTKTAEVASMVLNKQLTGADVAMIFAINKLTRSRGKMKKDNILDGIAYLAVIADLENLSDE